MSLILLPVLLTHIMFSGLRSRWTTPCLWMKLTPSMICSMYLITSLSVNSKSSSMIRSKSSPPEILHTNTEIQFGFLCEHPFRGWAWERTTISPSIFNQWETHVFSVTSGSVCSWSHDWRKKLQFLYFDSLCEFNDQTVGFYVTHISRTMTMSDLPSKASIHWTSFGWWRLFMMLISCRTLSFSFAEYALMNLPAQTFFVAFSTSLKTWPNFPLSANTERFRPHTHTQSFYTWVKTTVEGQMCVGGWSLTFPVSPLRHRAPSPSRLFWWSRLCSRAPSLSLEYNMT